MGKRNLGSHVLSVTQQQFYQDLSNAKHLDRLVYEPRHKSLMFACYITCCDVVNSLPNQRELSHSGREAQDVLGLIVSLCCPSTPGLVGDEFCFRLQTCSVNVTVQLLWWSLAGGRHMGHFYH